MGAKSWRCLAYFVHTSEWSTVCALLVIMQFNSEKHEGTHYPIYFLCSISQTSTIAMVRYKQFPLEVPIAQIWNFCLFSRQVSSGQCVSFADLLVQCSVPVLDALCEGIPLQLTAKVEEPGNHGLTPALRWAAPISRGEAAADIWWWICTDLSVCMPQPHAYMLVHVGRVKHPALFHSLD